MAGAVASHQVSQGIVILYIENRGLEALDSASCVPGKSRDGHGFAGIGGV